MYSSDGLPKSYYDVTEDKQLMSEMKRDVFALIDSNGMKESNVICQELNINTMFLSEVEDFIEEYKSIWALRKAGVKEVVK